MYPANITATIFVPVESELRKYQPCGPVDALSSQVDPESDEVCKYQTEAASFVPVLSDAKPNQLPDTVAGKGVPDGKYPAGTIAHDVALLA